MDVALIGIPFDGWGRSGNQARAATVLREAGLVEAFSGRHNIASTTELVLPAPEQRRGPLTGLLNEAALTQMIDQLGSHVQLSIEQGQVPVVYGGDCTTLLGTMPALTGDPGTGLVFIDGHEDAMPLDVSEDGEAANTEMGLLLGITGRLLRGPLARAVGTLDREQVAMLGERDHQWRAQHNLGSLADIGVWSRSWREVAQGPDAAGHDAVQHVLSRTNDYWLHVDLDVLDPAEFASQGVPGVADTPGGLTWDQLRTLLHAAVAIQTPLGLSVAIYDPDQDPDGHDATQIVSTLASLASHWPSRSNTQPSTETSR